MNVFLSLCNSPFTFWTCRPISCNSVWTLWRWRQTRPRTF